MVAADRSGQSHFQLYLLECLHGVLEAKPSKLSCPPTGNLIVRPGKREIAAFGGLKIHLKRTHVIPEERSD